MYNILISCLMLWACSSARHGQSTSTPYFFEAHSISSDATEYISLSVAYDSLGNATVSKSSRAMLPADKVQVSMDVEYSEIVFSWPSGPVISEYENIPNGQRIYWIPINADIPAQQVDGGTTITTWCEACSGCKVNFIVSGGSAVVSCNNSCCVLKSKNNISHKYTGGGMFIVASSVIYSF